MNRDEIKGKATAIKGKIKQNVANLTDDPRLRDEGADDEVVGNTQAAVGRAKRRVGEAVEKVGRAIKRA